MTLELWGFFIAGAWVNILKRAYLKVTGPDQSISSYTAYFKYFWPALLFRSVFGGALYWLTFYPDTLASLLRLCGWSSLGTIPGILPQLAPVALLAGLATDSGLDFISLKIPWLQGFIPPLTLTKP